MLVGRVLKTSGYTVQGTVTGSYGEQEWVRIGRAYRNIYQAIAAAYRLRASGIRDALVIDGTGKAIDPDIFSRTLA